MLPALDLPALLQLALVAFSILSGAILILRFTAFRYFVVDASFDSANSQMCGGGNAVDGGGTDTCADCAAPASKTCSRCKRVRYCSQACQSKHWKSHKLDCKEEILIDGKTDIVSFDNGVSRRTKSSGFSSISLVPTRGTCKVLQEPKKILFPYGEFVKLFNWDNPGFRPCGLVNCGNSCFANVVLQCLASTRPLLAYLLERDHKRGCIRKRNEWCFLCELQTHVRRATESLQPFSPVNILHRLPNIGGNLGYGRQEDAHEFMRFAIDTMQSVCLDEFGGEKALEPSSQETTLIQYIFGGHLQSQVICTKCNAVSNRYENMMDLTVEIQGNAESLEECLDQFTMKEWLDGENMYKCDGCNDYVKARKQLTIHQAPNILTIALKRFQSGRFGKLNKTISFPENLDLTPYMSASGNRDDINLYTLYAVVVHLDMLNASFFGHYVCYTKDYYGRWYRIDDSKVVNVDVEEVLAQGAYMLLYSRIGARREPFIKPMKPAKEHPVLEMTTDGSEPRPIAMPFFRDTGHEGNASFESNAMTGKESNVVDLSTAAGVRPVSVDIDTDDSQIGLLRKSDSSAHVPIDTLPVKPMQSDSSAHVPIDTLPVEPMQSDSSAHVPIDTLPVEPVQSNSLPVVETSSTESLAVELEELGESMDCEEPCLSPCDSGPSSSPSIVTSSLSNSVTELCDRSDPVICMEQDSGQNDSAEAFKLSKNNVDDVVNSSSTALVDIPLESSSQVVGANSQSVSGKGLKPIFSRGFLDTPKRKEPTGQADQADEFNHALKINGYANGHTEQNMCNNGANLELLNGKVYGDKIDQMELVNDDQSCNNGFHNGFQEPDISVPSVNNGFREPDISVPRVRCNGPSLESVAANGKGSGLSFVAAGFLNKSYKTSIENRAAKKDTKKTDVCCKVNGFTGLQSSNSKSAVPCMAPGFLNKPYTRPMKASRTGQACVTNGNGFIERALVCQNGNREYKPEASLVESNGHRADPLPGMRFEGSATSSLKEHSD